MNAAQKTCAQRCLVSAETDSMTFPGIVGTRAGAGFESYAIDFHRASATYYLPLDENCELSPHSDGVVVNAELGSTGPQSAIRDAETLAPGYSYKGFCGRAKAAGCVGYLASFLD